MFANSPFSYARDSLVKLGARSLCFSLGLFGSVFVCVFLCASISNYASDEYMWIFSLQKKRIKIMLYGLNLVSGLLHFSLLVEFCRMNPTYVVD